MVNSAVFFNTRDHTVELGDLQLDGPGPDEVVVRSKVVGLCRSDIELLHGHLDAQLDVLEPIVPGHEWSGVVEQVGSEVTHLRPGDRVVGECVIADNHWFGFTAHGAASGRFTVPARLVHVFPAELSYAQAALIEPFTIAYNAIREIGGIDEGASVVVIGAGMIGQSCVAIARGFGANVTIIDPVEQRRELAGRLGAKHLAASFGEAAELIAADARADAAGDAANAAGGADLVIEASGSAIGIASSFGIARFAGRIVNIGICAATEVTAPLHLIQAKNLTVRGVTGSAGIWPEAIAFLLEKGIDLSPVITATYGIDEITDAIAATDAGNVKVHVLVDGADD